MSGHSDRPQQVEVGQAVALLTELVREEKLPAQLLLDVLANSPMHELPNQLAMLAGQYGLSLEVTA